MVVVTVELWPLGNPEHKEHLGTAYIANDLSGSDTQGNYNIKLTKIHSDKNVWKTGRVEGFPRKRLGAWDLIYRALRDIVGDRNA